jgi:MFS family permease
VNIGNARLYGLEEDLGLEGDQFQISVSILFVTYVLSELPSNLVIKKLRPSRWIAFITTGWGIVATLTGVVQSYGGLIACRLVLGALEGGLFPGLTIYLTLFYTRKEIALRVGYLFVSAAIAGSLGGLLAYGIGFMDGVQGQRGWRWIMIIEGLPTVVLGIASWWWLADSPETARYLSEEERRVMMLRKQRQVGHTTSADEFHKADVVAGLKDWKIWAFCIGQFGVDTMLYGYSVRLPPGPNQLLFADHLADLPPNHHPWPRHLDDRTGSSSHDPVLCPGSHHLPDGRLVLRSTPAARAPDRGLRTRVHRRLRDSHRRRLQWRQILRLFPGCHGLVCYRWHSAGVATQQ